MSKAFITGVNGFVGGYLVKYLSSQGYQIAAVDQSLDCAFPEVAYSQVSILDTQSLVKSIAQIMPDEVYHLAAISYLPDADTSPGFALQTNIIGTVSLLDAVRTTSPAARVLLIGSSKEYDTSLSSQAIEETTQPNPTSFYGLSKYAAELVGQQYARQFGLDVRGTRSFNHTGPGQTAKYVCSDWARQVAEISLGLREPSMTVGDLRAEIDFSDVRDVVRAYHAILAGGVKGEVYNVCSGRCVALKFVLDYLTAKAPQPVTIVSTEGKLRAHRTSVMLAGSKEKLCRRTGWMPFYSLEQTLDDVFGYWLEELKNRK